MVANARAASISDGGVLVTGANGFIGSALSSALADKRKTFRASVRSPEIQLPNAVTVSVGEIDGSTDWSSALKEVSTVVHLAARAHIVKEHAIDPLAEFRRINVDGTLNLVKQAKHAGVKRFIFISSIKVNGETTANGRPFKADDRPAPADPYAVSKHEAEKGLQEICVNSTMEYVIIRPPLVYGPGAKGNFLSLMRSIERETPLPLASVRNRRSLISIENLTDLIITCVESPFAANQIFLASDGEDLSTPDLLRKTAAALGKQARLFPIPRLLLSCILRLAGQSSAENKLCRSLQVDISKTRECLGWHPPLTVTEALHRTTIHYLENR